MTLAKEDIELMILPLISLLALLALAWPKPSISAIFLFIEAIAIEIYLASVNGITSVSFSAGLLLTFFAMMTVGSTYYFEVSFTRKLVNAPKLNIFIGTLLLIIFWKNSHKLTLPPSNEEKISNLISPYDTIFIILCCFAIFAILFCALIIFDMKNPKSGEQP